MALENFTSLHWHQKFYLVPFLALPLHMLAYSVKKALLVLWEFNVWTKLPQKKLEALSVDRTDPFLPRNPDPSPPSHELLSLPPCSISPNPRSTAKAVAGRRQGEDSTSSFRPAAWGPMAARRRAGRRMLWRGASCGWLRLQACRGWLRR